MNDGERTEPAWHGVVPTEVRRRLAEWPIATVLTVVAVGLAVVYANHFRIGSMLVAAGLLLAAALRLLLPARRAGLLIVRSRGLDVLLLLALGTAVVVLTIVVPTRRG